MPPTFWPLSPQIPLMRTASEPDFARRHAEGAARATPSA